MLLFIYKREAYQRKKTNNTTFIAPIFKVYLTSVNVNNQNIIFDIHMGLKKKVNSETWLQ